MHRSTVDALRTEIEGDEPCAYCHRVKPGERLSGIAAMHGVGVGAILDANPQKPRMTLASGEQVFAELSVGEDLVLPGSLGIDIFPTLITAKNVAAKLDEVNALVEFQEDEFVRALGRKMISVDDFEAWQNFATRWRKFYLEQRSREWMFDAKYVLSVTERYDNERYRLHEWLREIAPDIVRGPVEIPPEPPGGRTLDWDRIIAWGGTVAVVGAVIYLFGPTIREGAQVVAAKLREARS